MSLGKCFACGADVHDGVVFHLKDGTEVVCHRIPCHPRLERLFCETYMRRHPDVDQGPHARFAEPLPGDSAPTWRDKLAGWIKG